MPRLSSGIRTDSSFLNLKPIDLKDVRNEVDAMLVNDEIVIAAFKTIRDQVIFTNKRVFVINVQGVTGKKTAYFSYPYSKVQYYSIETAGVLDIDSELKIAFSNGEFLQFDFRSKVNIRQISQAIGQYIL